MINADVLENTRSMFCACPSFPQRFFLTRAVVQVSWLPEVTLSGFPCVCACATGTGTISALVGPCQIYFKRKNRLIFIFTPSTLNIIIPITVSEIIQIKDRYMENYNKMYSTCLSSRTGWTLWFILFSNNNESFPFYVDCSCLWQRRLLVTRQMYYKILH
jgi:hypothetical protein